MNDKGELVGAALVILMQRGVGGVRFAIKAMAANLNLEYVPAIDEIDI